MKFFEVICLVIMIFTIMGRPQLVESNNQNKPNNPLIELSGREVEKIGKGVGKGAERLGQNIARPFKKLFG